MIILVCCCILQTVRDPYHHHQEQSDLVHTVYTKMLIKAHYSKMTFLLCFLLVLKVLDLAMMSADAEYQRYWKDR